MKNFKQIIAVVLVLTLVAAASVGVTLAYLTDRDAKANIFTVGDVRIRLDENFEQGATLTPGVKIEKLPSITNTGINDAWVWATIAIPAALDGGNDASKNIVHFNYDKNSVGEDLWTWWDEEGNWLVETETIDGIKYNVYTVLYQSTLSFAESTLPVMTQVYMDVHMDIDPDGNLCWIENGVAGAPVWNVKENAYPVMFVSAYAIQAETFENVQEAYAAYQTQWADKGTEYADTIVDAATFAELTGANAMDVINVTEDIDALAYLLAFTEESAINLNEHTVSSDSGAFEITGGSVTVNNGELATGSAGNYGVIVSGADTKVTLNNVDVNSAGGAVGATGGAQVIVDGGSLTVNTKSTSGRYLVYAEGEGTVVTINDVDFTDFTKTSQNQKRAYVYAGEGATVIINSGTFGKASTRSGYTAGIMGKGTVIINGGTFGFNPSKWVAETSTCEKVGDVWVVTPNT